MFPTELCVFVDISMFDMFAQSKKFQFLENYHFRLNKLYTHKQNIYIYTYNFLENLFYTCIQNMKEDAIAKFIITNSYFVRWFNAHIQSLPI